MSRSNSKTITSLALNLVRAHFGDDISFDESSWELARFLDERGEHELSGYVLAQLPGSPSLSTMEIDPLSKVAMDMYSLIEERCGTDSKEAIDFRVRLARYRNDFYIRCKEEGIIR